MIRRIELKNVIKELIASVLLIALGTWQLFIFTLILLYGDVSIPQVYPGGIRFFERNMPILALEMALCAGIMALGFDRLHYLIKRVRAGNGYFRGNGGM